MRMYWAILAIAVGFAMTGSAAGEMTGYISDHSCAKSGAGKAKAMDWIKTDRFEACVKKCQKEGSALVFVTEDNTILKFDASSTDKATAHMGQRVKVTGTTTDGVLKVDTIATIEMPKP